MPAPNLDFSKTAGIIYLELNIGSIGQVAVCCKGFLSQAAVKKERGANPLHARYCMRESGSKRREPQGRKSAILGQPASGEGRFRARKRRTFHAARARRITKVRNPRQRASSPYVLQIADPPTTSPYGGQFSQLNRFRPMGCPLALLLRTNSPLSYRQRAVFLSKRRSEKRR